MYSYQERRDSPCSRESGCQFFEWDTRSAGSDLGRGIVGNVGYQNARTGGGMLDRPPPVVLD
jgi:hypothetical protein